jgi:signal transduction histidine kinase
MGLWDRWLADLRRPEAPTSRDELVFHLLAPAVVIVLAQLTDPGSLAQLLLLAPVALGFVLRGVLGRFPAEAFAVMVIVPILLVVGDDGALEGTLFLAATMVLYTAWSLGSLTRSVIILGVAMATPWLIAQEFVPDSGIRWEPWAMASVLTFVLGRTLRRHRILIEQLEQARRALASQAVAEERRRIARELHDLAGHTLAAMLLHVTGARHVLRRDPVEAERALLDAEAVGRSSLDQIRVTVAALRADEHGADPALAGTADLATLAEGYRRAGLDLSVFIAHDAAGIDGPVGTAIHRIAREALANVARHAPDNHVRLECVVVDGCVRLTVVDHGAAAPRPETGSGHFGLVGMAERARALGGRLDAGPGADGWSVTAALPLARPSAPMARP